MSEAASSPRRAFGQDAVEEIMARVLEAQAEAYEKGPYSDAPRQRRDALEQRIRQLVDENAELRAAGREFLRCHAADMCLNGAVSMMLDALDDEARAALLRSEEDSRE
jgi:hypothetical protein